MIRHGDPVQLSDPRDAWTLCLPLVPAPATAAGPSPRGTAARTDPEAETLALAEAVFDTLRIDVHAAAWAELATTLSDADVPLEIGDVTALRRLAKVDADLVAVIARWIRTAHPTRP